MNYSQKIIIATVVEQSNLFPNVYGSSSTGLETASLSTDTELNRMQYINITTNTRITATVCWQRFLL
ncbi:MAG: hypothetical protein WC319_11350 [Candidatus Paceibacterota bacterium]